MREVLVGEVGLAGVVDSNAQSVAGADGLIVNGVLDGLIVVGHSDVTRRALGRRPIDRHGYAERGQVAQRNEGYYESSRRSSIDLQPHRGLWSLHPVFGR